MTMTPAAIRRALLVSATVLALTGCATIAPPAFTSMVSGGVGLANFNAIGDANWRVVDGAIQADKGVGFLISKNSYTDFEMRVEFWADNDANSGVFLRLQDLKTVTASNSYEVNIFDNRPEQAYATGAIVDIAKVNPVPKAAGKWNVFLITVKGTQLTVFMNGLQTVSVQDSKHKSGPFALQYAPGIVKDSGTIRFRKVEIRPI